MAILQYFFLNCLVEFSNEINWARVSLCVCVTLSVSLCVCESMCVSVYVCVCLCMSVRLYVSVYGKGKLILGICETHLYMYQVVTFVILLVVRLSF